MRQGEQHRLDEGFKVRGLDQATRNQLWLSVARILAHGPLGEAGSQGRTGLALGYVQSGKTTAITALTARAADDGSQVVVALLGSTNLLLDQNTQRLRLALGIDGRQDYRWVDISNASGATQARELTTWLERGRTIVLPVLKHAGRITALADVLSRAVPSTVPVLIIDDEADQASLNTEVSKATESRTYAALGALRVAVPNHLYVQFTATPYAPLLLEPGDVMRPDFVELLHPGPGYTGGREFFVDHANTVVRAIPTLDEQKPKSAPTQLPKSLETAAGSFIAGTALLMATGAAEPPVSMLVHSTQRNDIQARYHFLLQRLFKQWSRAASAADSVASLPGDIVEERLRIVTLGAPDIDDSTFLDRVRHVLAETTLWLVNSASDVNKIMWNVAPVHVLVGGNKLDRGFTVEGLTVTYMNRPASTQLDTLEQRARAFGYRGDLLPYCQFFASPRTLKVLRETVDTEYDLRARLRDWLDAGNDVTTWAEQVGLLLPAKTRPTRQNVLGTLTQFNRGPGWHQLRRPSTNPHHRAANESLVERLGLLAAAPTAYGRLEHPTIERELRDVVDSLLVPWHGVQSGSSPGWAHDDILDLLGRLAPAVVPVILMRHPDGGPREREWDPELGFVNLLQGADPRARPGKPFYAGDRATGGVDEHPDRVVVQVHLVKPRGTHDEAVMTLAVHAGQRTIVRRG